MAARQRGDTSRFVFEPLVGRTLGHRVHSWHEAERPVHRGDVGLDVEGRRIQLISQRCFIEWFSSACPPCAIRPPAARIVAFIATASRSTIGLNREHAAASARSPWSNVQISEQPARSVVDKEPDGTTPIRVVQVIDGQGDNAIDHCTNLSSPNLKSQSVPEARANVGALFVPAWEIGA